MIGEEECGSSGQYSGGDDRGEGEGDVKRMQQSRVSITRLGQDKRSRRTVSVLSSTLQVCRVLVVLRDVSARPIATRPQLSPSLSLRLACLLVGRCRLEHKSRVIVTLPSKPAR
jgi:hypothetical protein